MMKYSQNGKNPNINNVFCILLKGLCFQKIIIEEANDTNFLDLDVFWYVAFPFFHSPSRDKSEFKGSITNLPPISKWN